MPHSNGALRVLCLLGNPDVTGVPMGLLGTLRRLHPRRVDATVVAPAGSRFLPLFRRSGIRCLTLREDRPVDFLGRLIRRERTQIVHSLCPSGEGAQAAFLTDLPHVWHLAGIPEQVFYVSSKADLREHLLLMERLSDVLVVECRDLWRRLPAALRRKSAFIPNCGTDPCPPARINLGRSSRGAAGSRGAFRIGMVGNFYPAKRHPDFLLAARRIHGRYPRARFVIAGKVVGQAPRQRAHSSAYRGAVLRAIRRLRLAGCVRVTSYHPVRRFSWIGKLDLLLVPSFEGWGQAMLEAGLCGVPVAAANVGGAREIVENGRTGLLVPYRRPTALAEAAVRLLEDPRLRARMGRAGRRRVLTRFSADRHARRLERLYRALARRNA